MSNMRNLAKTPPMGWNSFDCFGAQAREEHIKANADYLAKHLKKYGWEYVVVDIAWYAEYSNPKVAYSISALNLDEYGRLAPSPNLYPSSAEGKGFKPLADYIHSKGLKFGIHIMRGIPIVAVERNTPILGSNA
ncbi:MAG: alpha-galactosidase, partial [Armatimonadota bacterium]|nr:alpha-galactosidase [Armatimonadota bacterium]